MEALPVGVPSGGPLLGSRRGPEVMLHSSASARWNGGRGSALPGPWELSLGTQFSSVSTSWVCLFPNTCTLTRCVIEWSSCVPSFAAGWHELQSELQSPVLCWSACHSPSSGTLALTVTSSTVVPCLPLPRRALMEPSGAGVCVCVRLSSCALGGCSREDAALSTHVPHGSSGA